MKVPLLALLAATLVCAQQPVGSISGIVVEAGSGQGIPGARLILTHTGDPEPPAGLIAAPDGRFSFDALPPGEYTLQAARDGFAAPGSPAAEPAVLTLAAGARLNGVMLELTRTAVVSGQVVDPSGRPIRGVQISAVQPWMVFGQSRLVRIGDAAETDDRGRYRLYDIAPGEYHLRASYDPPAGAPHYPERYYPGVPDPAEALQIVLRPGEERSGLDFHMRRVSGVRIRGRATGIDPYEGRGVKATLRRAGSTTSASQVTLSFEGRFEFNNIEPGVYELGIQVGESAAAVELNVNGVDITDLELELEPLQSLEITATIEGDTEDQDVTSASVQMTPRSRIVPLASGFARFDNQGTGRIRLLPGEYGFHIEPPQPDLYLRSARQGDTDLLETGVLRVGSEPLQPLRLIFSTRGARLSGTVADPDGNPIPGAAIILLPEGGTPELNPPRRISADQRGQYRITGIAPGSYRVLAFRRLAHRAEQAPDFAESHQEQSIALTFAENASQTMDLPVSE